MESKEEEEEGEEEILLHLFDLYWFKHKILTNPKPSQKQTHKELLDQESTKPIRPCPLQVITPSIPKYPISHGGVESPTSVLTLSKETDQFSDDEATKGNKKNNNNHHHHHRRKRLSRFRKRLTELQQEELKGFMELGFVFSEEAKESPWLVGILPGLQRIGTAATDGDDQEERADVYLPETWKKMKMKKKKNTSSKMMMMVMMNWRLPSLSNEDDMKKHLRVWAHAVASVVT